NFLWAIPIANLALLVGPGVLVAAVNRLRPGLVSLRAAVWLFATLAIWGPLLRLPLLGVASLLLAVGLGRWVSRGVAASAPRYGRFAARGLMVLASLLALTAAISLGRQ